LLRKKRAELREVPAKQQIARTRVAAAPGVEQVQIVRFGRLHGEDRDGSMASQVPVTSLERQLQAARPEVDDGEERLAAMVASRLFGPTHAPPARVGRFTLIERIGRGGSGDVYAAYDPLLDRKVALKLLRPDAGRMGGEGWLLREARAAARLTDPNVVAIHEVGELGDGREGIYVAMEFIDGVTLRAWLGERPPLAQILDVFVHAGRGLAAAHEAGVVHRDFKPKSRRPSQTAPQPTDRPHSHSQGRFERVDVYRAAPGRSGVPQVLAKRWQRTGPPEDRRGLAPRHSQGRHHEPFPSHPFATAAPRAAAGR
jgi:hypothetical protein